MNKHQQITACAFLYNAERKLFVARRAATKKFLPNVYELVGGHTEFGETLEDSLKRELKEELEIDVIVESPFYAFTYLADDNATHTVEVDFFAKMTDLNQKIMIHPDDHSDYRWIDESEVDQYFESNDSERIAVIEGFRKLKSSSRDC